MTPVEDLHAGVIELPAGIVANPEAINAVCKARLAMIEERIGRPVRESAAEIETVLGLEELSGA